MLILIASVQGLVVFGSAYALWHWRGFSNVWLKAPLMLMSWLGWCILTIAGYAALGGDGGLMDGFGLVLILCITALLGSLLFLLGWVLA
ncbi:hypothetical protein [Novosphingobium taihuense]|uniref:Uncharacterized protein n=1 Tax=Novosphingobium taihuense TaxID=260085 RepID=A0A7W7AEG9_9SPHN|nr:hypothetical protein [Novosphingobium taihuense]MBB4615523.1 hypothetical protein [Novosphingobium taihuense]TWH82815.1 hypothetical protein IQ25_03095 [Novosphingobium taihuense]